MGGLSTLHLLHCVLPRACPLLDLSPCVEGAAVKGIHAQGLFAVASQLPDRLSDGAAPEDLFADPDRTAKVAMAHHTMLTRLAQDHDLAPVRLGALHETAAAAEAAIVANEVRFRDALARIGGAVEFEVKLTETGKPTAPAPMLAAASGRDYLKARSTLLARQRQQTPPASVFVRQVMSDLAPVARSIDVLGTKRSDAAAQRRVLSAAVLVSRTEIAAFANIVSSLQADGMAHGLALAATGPLPAYHFAAEAG
jgi:hypothetical protein